MIDAFVAIPVIRCALAWRNGRLDARSLAARAKTGRLVAVGLPAAMFALNDAFAGRGVPLPRVNAGCALVGFTVAGAIIGA